MWGWNEEYQMKEWGEQRQGKMDKSKQVSGHMDTARNESKGRWVKKPGKRNWKKERKDWKEIERTKERVRYVMEAASERTKCRRPKEAVLLVMKTSENPALKSHTLSWSTLTGCGQIGPGHRRGIHDAKMLQMSRELPADMYTSAIWFLKVFLKPFQLLTLYFFCTTVLSILVSTCHKWWLSLTFELLEIQ